ncbi:MAG: 4Fe-4S dicluster domain-containing protein [Candidatus Omnitrophica bacterium]|nr:4Fe-4S dicluster domain-containing protein [Candidatus Omnitrophota bacterium]
MRKMAYIRINKERCKGCLLCSFNCPKKLIVQDKDLNLRGVRVVSFRDKNKECRGCAFCALVCPDVCIEVYK